MIGYLLAVDHPVGGPKARYFCSRGYAMDRPEELEAALRKAAADGEVVTTETTEWGTKYLVASEVRAPDGGVMEVATVWIVSKNDPPALVTAYPRRGG